MLYGERADMIGISENAVLAFCAALSMDIIDVMIRVSRGVGVSSVHLSSFPHQHPHSLSKQTSPDLHVFDHSNLQHIIDALASYCMPTRRA